MADFNNAWLYTSENEGADSSYEQFTKWGITLPFLKYNKLGVPTNDFIKNLTRESAGEIVKKSIWKIVKGELIINQWVANMLLDAGFNKPAYTIKWCCEIFNIDSAYHIDKFVLPDTIISKINADPKLFYAAFWAKWWYWAINSGHFLIGAAGMSKRINRYVEYGKIGRHDDDSGALRGWQDCKNEKVKGYLEVYLLKKKFDSY